MDEQLSIRSRSELDVLLVNFDAALRVRKRSDFFSWVQGVFQGIVQHEVLICAVADPAAGSYRLEWVSSHPVAPPRLEALCQTGSGLVYRLMELWELLGCTPLLLDARLANDFAAESLLNELSRLELHNALAHGVPDVTGRAHAFFSFSGLSGKPGREQTLRLELAVPHLHAAWVRANRYESGAPEGHAIVARHILTAREVEILGWVAQGKSNIEIAQILSISHLTVKNHVQKILRKLDVHNRAQAAARGIVLNLARSG